MEEKLISSHYLLFLDFLMDIVYILKETDDNNVELLYSLRSLKNIKHWKVFIVWFKPDWIKNIIHIPADDPYKVKSLNALHKIKIACNNKRISEEFVLMNDDFYILKPTEIKYFNRWTIESHIKYRDKKFQSMSKYCQNLEKTFALFPKWLDFSLHCPIIYNKQMFLDMCEKYDMNEWYLLRNLYCNHYWIEWEFMEDCKILEVDNFDINNYWDFLSTNDWQILKIYDKIWLVDKSKYEDIWEWHSLYCIINNKIMLARAKYNISIDNVFYEKWLEYLIKKNFELDWRTYFDIIKYL